MDLNIFNGIKYRSVCYAFTSTYNFTFKDFDIYKQTLTHTCKYILAALALSPSISMLHALHVRMPMNNFLHLHALQVYAKGIFVSQLNTCDIIDVSILTGSHN